MSRVYRITDARYTASALSGMGAYLAGGRWNSPGTYLVYTSGSRALAQLEMRVHHSAVTAPTTHVLLAIEIPDGVSRRKLSPATLPAGWRTYPAPSALAAFGDAWAHGAATAVLEVPSAVVPEEPNFLINPHHPDSALVRVIDSAPLVYDPRLF